ncbi:MAG: TM2 domain-containing protein [Myxococcota bacterium]
MKKLWVSYLLYFFGLHRIYLEKYFSGVLYIFTLGFFGIGTILDLFLMPELVRDANMKIFVKRQLDSADFENEMSLKKILSHDPDQKNKKKQTNTLQRILQAANHRGGTITEQELIMDTGLPAGEAEQQLEQLLKQNFCTLEVGDDGCMFYKFQGLRNAKTERATRSC